MLEIDLSTYAVDNNKIALSNPQMFPAFWKVKFAKTTTIKSTLIINRDNYAAGVSRILNMAVTFGDNPDVT
jgi:hypothetical protein